jgi:hypothetical protein
MMNSIKSDTEKLHDRPPTRIPDGHHQDTGHRCLRRTAMAVLQGLNHVACIKTFNFYRFDFFLSDGAACYKLGVLIPV